MTESLSHSDFRRLENDIADLLEEEPFHIELMPARFCDHTPIIGVYVTDCWADEPGAGHGARLIPEVIEIIRGAGFQIYLMPVSDDAERFWVRMGFRPMDHVRSDVVLAPPDALWLTYPE